MFFSFGQSNAGFQYVFWFALKWKIPQDGNCNEEARINHGICVSSMNKPSC